MSPQHELKRLVPLSPGRCIFYVLLGLRWENRVLGMTTANRYNERFKQGLPHREPISGPREVGHAVETPSRVPRTQVSPAPRESDVEQRSHSLSVAVERHSTLIQEHGVSLFLFGGLVFFAAPVIRALAAPNSSQRSPP